MRLLASTALLVALVFPAVSADAKPKARSKRSVAAKRVIKRTPVDPQKLGAHARVSYQRAGELRPTVDIEPRRPEPLTAEEEAAASIQKLLRGPVLRKGVTGLFVADARTGEPLFAVNATDPMNPASNVKLISTATALELLGPDFRYPTRVLGPSPVGGTVPGDIYLLGSYDPTLSASDLHEIAAAMARSGITTITGNVAVGSDRTRDGIYRSLIPIEITAGEPGEPPIAIGPADHPLVEIAVTATTAKRAMRPRLTYKTAVTKTPTGQPRITLTIGGTIGKGGTTMYPLWTKQRTANAAYALMAALRAHGISITGDLKVTELGDFVGDTVLRGGLPVELGRHESQPLADIVSRVNKRSVNWLADRVIMTAAALAKHTQPSMQVALDAMYNWLSRHPHIAKGGVTIDTGSGLSYRTQITPMDLVSVVRAAGGFAGETDSKLAQAWRSSLSVAGTDGTLRSRFRGTNAAGRIHGKTGTLSTVIAISGILDIDPTRPLAFALVTNGDGPLAKPLVRRAHEQVVAEICKYLSKTSNTTPIQTQPTHATPPALPDGADIELDESTPDAVLDAETAATK
ncbi:MAG TPA: D-alanyl-D-alanine carboxypeptidase/D-alanyl-D-alanine-endopeptidase [Kofleriaceae bacterium]|nr:D-alanyl-D-alanine carboxypeptidase/D-alanyl-D-alanine-endopeptidase [Kofleriaceae bacterium]